MIGMGTQVFTVAAYSVVFLSYPAIRTSPTENLGKIWQEVS